MKDYQIKIGIYFVDSYNLDTDYFESNFISSIKLTSNYHDLDTHYSKEAAVALAKALNGRAVSVDKETLECITISNIYEKEEEDL